MAGACSLIMKNLNTGIYTGWTLKIIEKYKPVWRIL
jgi:hypothetical protein